MSTLLLKQVAAAILIGLALALGTGFLADAIFENDTPQTVQVIDEDVAAEEPENTIPEEPANAEEEPALGVLLASATTDQGQKIYGRCRACHDNAAEGSHKIGPNLYGIVGADVGRFEDFNYSGALAGYEGTWSPEFLDAYLASPRDAIPGNKMTFGGLDQPADRAALIVYLNELSDNPLDFAE